MPLQKEGSHSFLWAVISAHVVTWIRRWSPGEKNSCVSTLQMKQVQQRGQSNFLQVSHKSIAELATGTQCCDFVLGI